MPLPLMLLLQGLSPRAPGEEDRAQVTVGMLETISHRAQLRGPGWPETIYKDLLCTQGIRRATLWASRYPLRTY